MLQHKAQVCNPSSLGAEASATPRFSSVYSCPAKVFLLGEYAVLAGLPALVASLGPRFEMRVSFAATANREEPPARSPLGRLVKWAEGQGLPKLHFEFKDPYQGRGGFGASTAEFAMAWMAYSQFDEKFPQAWNRNWRTPLNHYRSLMEGELLIPSGADLVSQWQGGVSLFNPTEKYCRDVWPILDWSRLLVFSATHQESRKVRTHEHLEKLSKSGFPETAADWLEPLKGVISNGISAIQNQDHLNLGQSFNDYADILSGVGLECEKTTLDRKAFLNVPGVLGVKGTGALQSDGLIVLSASASRESTLEKILLEARKRDLCLVSEGITSQMGITCQNRE